MTPKRVYGAVKCHRQEGDYTVSFEKTQTDASKDIVSAVLSGQASTTQEDGTVVHDGITSIDFAQNVTVSEVLLAKTGIVNVDTAYEAVTKSSENRVLYEVKAEKPLNPSLPITELIKNRFTNGIRDWIRIRCLQRVR